MEDIWKNIKALNKKTDDYAPWKKTADERKDFLIESLLELNDTGKRIEPFMPQTGASVIKSTLGKIRKAEPLFPRL